MIDRRQCGVRIGRVRAASVLVLMRQCSWSRHAALEAKMKLKECYQIQAVKIRASSVTAAVGRRQIVWEVSGTSPRDVIWHRDEMWHCLQPTTKFNCSKCCFFP